MSTDLSTKLTEAERRKFNDLDGIVTRGKQAFAEVGAALCIIRDQRLYREEWGTFEEYCEQRHGWGSSRARQLIAAHEVVAEIESVTGCNTPVPETHARELVAVPEGQRAEALAVAHDIATESGREKPTAEDVREARKRYVPVKERKPRKQKAEIPSDMAAALVKAAEKHTNPSKEQTHDDARVHPEADGHDPVRARVGEADGQGQEGPARVGAAGDDHPRDRGDGEVAPSTDGRVDTPPVTPSTEASSEAVPSPRASSAEGAVVLFVRTLAVPCFEDVGGMTDADAKRVALLRAWCGDVLESYRKHRRQTS